MHTRRHFNGLLLATLAAGGRCSFAAPASRMVGGVHLGLESYSLMPLRGEDLQDRWIGLMHQLGFAECSVFEPLLQPVELTTKLQAARESKDRQAIDTTMQELNQWRAGLSVSSFRDMRSKFSAAGVRFAFFSGSTLSSSSTDADLEHVCALTQALGAEFVTVAAGKSIVKRLVPLVARYDLRIGIQGRPNAHSTDPDAIARAEDFEEAVGYSSRCAIDIDIGDATGAGFDVMPFVTRNHARIARIELKDRKRDNTSMPWGQGDTPLKDVLLYVRENRLPIRCYIDCDYAPATQERIASILNCRAYIHSVLGV